MRSPFFLPLRTGVRRSRAGFSLIEVSLALVVAAGGLLAIFGLFPVSLRQSKMSERDMAENAFGTTLLETIAGNVRMIDDVATWNDPDEFLKVALAGTGVREASTVITGKKMNQNYQRSLSGASAAELDFSPDTVDVGKDYDSKHQPPDERIWYVGREEFEGRIPDDEKLVLPPQFLIRFLAVRREARARTGTSSSDVLSQSETDGSFSTSESGKGWNQVWLPNVYVFSVVSTDGGFPETYIREPLYSQEFTFLHRP